MIKSGRAVPRTSGLVINSAFVIRISSFFSLRLVFWIRARERSGMKSFPFTIVAGCACLLLASVCKAADIEWTPEANMDHQLFPSLIIATASVRPVEPDDQEAEKPDPYL